MDTPQTSMLKLTTAKNEKTAYVAKKNKPEHKQSKKEYLSINEINERLFGRLLNSKIEDTNTSISRFD